MKKRFIATIITVVFVLTCFMSITAMAYSPSWQYGQSYTDHVSTYSSQNLGKHSHQKVSIGANTINITTPAGNPAQSYHLELYTRSWGIYSKFGANVACKTSGTGGYYYWENSNPSKDCYAYIRVVKDTSGSAPIAGTLISTSRSWE